MKKYMIPICMAAGAVLGLLIGLLAQFAWQVFTCAGAAFGIATGAVIQLIWNQTLPDSYFAKKQRKTDMDTSLFAEEEVEKREEKTIGHTFHVKNVEEEDDEVATVQLTEEELAAKAERERRAAQRKQWEALQAQRRQQAQGQRTATQQRPATQRPAVQPQRPQTSAPKRTTYEEPKRRVIVEEDED